MLTTRCWAAIQGAMLAGSRGPLLYCLSVITSLGAVDTPPAPRGAARRYRRETDGA